MSGEGMTGKSSDGAAIGKVSAHPPGAKEPMRPIHWIETELSRHFEDLDLSQGVDLDRNGTIEGPERIDRDSDGEVDPAEWRKFMGNNKAALSGNIGIISGISSGLL